MQCFLIVYCLWYFNSRSTQSYITHWTILCGFWFPLHPDIVKLPKDCGVFVLLLGNQSICQSANSHNTNSHSSTAVSCIHIVLKGICLKPSTHIFHISGDLNLRIQLELECMSCSCWQQRQAPSLVGRNGCWGFEPTLRTPSSLWWSGGGFHAGFAHVRDTWCTRRAPRVHSNDTAQRSGRRIYEHRRGQYGGEKGMQVKCEGWMQEKHGG